MAKGKGVRIIVTLECTECRTNPDKRSAGVSRYTSTKNRRNTTARLELKKFWPHCNRNIGHKEIKKRLVSIVAVYLQLSPKIQ